MGCLFVGSALLAVDKLPQRPMPALICNLTGYVSFLCIANIKPCS